MSKSATETRKIINKVLFLHIPILFALFILTDNNYYYSNDDSNNDVDQKYRHHLAVLTALRRHPPSARIFRCLLEFVLLGLCASWSIHVWGGVVEKSLLGRLMFDIPYTLKYTIDGDDGDGLNGMGSNTISTEVEMVSLLGSDEINHKEDAPREDETPLVDQTKITDQDDNRRDDDHHVRSPFQRQYQPLPPSAAYVCNASLDILLLILVTLLLFTISSSAGGVYIDQNINVHSSAESKSILSTVGDVAAPTFPLLLFIFLALRSIFPWTHNKRYVWTVLAYTVGAPMYEVEFRDGMVGDILTSMVRPIQDLVYTLFYVSMGLQGWWTVQYANAHPHREDGFEPTNSFTRHPLEQTQPAVERSWILHTIILPTLTLSPLWWRFCQTLRQTYVTRKRWPYLGNAGKYFVAAQVAVLAVYVPNMRDNWGWKIAAVGATLYQIFWDVFMDWGLVEFIEFEEGKGGSIVKPLTDRWLRWRLRSNRLYKSKTMYLSITIINVVLRFFWTLTFIPDRYLSASSGLLLESFTGMGGDLREMIGPTLAAAEIVRRTLWSFLRLELEALTVVQNEIQQHPKKQQQKKQQGCENGMDISMLEMEDGLEPMSIDSSFKSSSKRVALWNNMSTLSDVHVLWELCFYATAFTSFGILVCFHRQVY